MGRPGVSSGDTERSIGAIWDGLLDSSWIPPRGSVEQRHQLLAIASDVEIRIAGHEQDGAVDGLPEGDRHGRWSKDRNSRLR